MPQHMQVDWSGSSGQSSFVKSIMRLRGQNAQIRLDGEGQGNGTARCSTPLRVTFSRYYTLGRQGESVATHLTDMELEVSDLRTSLCAARSLGEEQTARVAALVRQGEALRARVALLEGALVALARASTGAVDASLSHSATFLSKLRAAQVAKVLAADALELVATSRESDTHGPEDPRAPADSARTRE